MFDIKEDSEVFEKRFGEKLECVSMILSVDFNFNFANDRNIQNPKVLYCLILSFWRKFHSYARVF